MVGVTDGEGVSQGIVKRDVASDQVRHGGRPFVRYPLIILTLIPGRLGGGPVMRQILNKLKSQIRSSGMERQQIAIVIRLVPNGISVGQINGAIITEAAHAAQGSIIMIKRAVLLHHNDDVFNIIDGPGSAVGGNREGPSNARWKAAVTAPLAS